MDKLIEKIPSWLIGVSIFGLFALILVSFATDRSFIIGGLEFGFKKSEEKDIMIHKPKPYESDWIKLKRKCHTISEDIGFDGLPSMMMAFYKLKDGSIFPWGINQYGDANQSNGVLLDFDQKGKLYIRHPCGSKKGDNVLHLGWYQNRNNSDYEEIVNRKEVDIKILLWPPIDKNNQELPN